MYKITQPKITEEHRRGEGGRFIGESNNRKKKKKKKMLRREQEKRTEGKEK